MLRLLLDNDTGFYWKYALSNLNEITSILCIESFSYMLFYSNRLNIHDDVFGNFSGLSNRARKHIECIYYLVVHDPPPLIFFYKIWYKYITFNDLSWCGLDFIKFSARVVIAYMYYLPINVTTCVQVILRILFTIIYVHIYQFFYYISWK